MQSEKSIEAHLVKKTKERGGRAYKFTSPSRRGVPDRVVVLPGGKIAFVEVKRPGEKPTPLQRKEIKFLRDLGQQVFVLDCKEDTRQVLDAIER